MINQYKKKNSEIVIYQKKNMTQMFDFNKQENMDLIEKYLLNSIKNRINQFGKTDLNYENLYNTATTYYDEGNYEMAEKHYLMTIYKDINAIFLLTFLYVKQRKYELAKKYYRMGMNKDYIYAMYEIAIMYEKQEKYELAEKYYLMAIEHNYFKAVYNLAILYDNLDKYDMAKYYYLMAIRCGYEEAMEDLVELCQYCKDNEIDV